MEIVGSLFGTVSVAFEGRPFSVGEARSRLCGPGTIVLSRGAAFAPEAIGMVANPFWLGWVSVSQVQMSSNVEAVSLTVVRASLNVCHSFQFIHSLNSCFLSNPFTHFEVPQELQPMGVLWA